MRKILNIARETLSLELFKARLKILSREKLYPRISPSDSR